MVVRIHQGQLEHRKQKQLRAPPLDREDAAVRAAEPITQ